MAEVTPEIRERLRVDTPYYARNCLKIVNKSAQLVPLVPNRAQLRFDAAMEKQRAEGLPIRVIVLKARKLGFSTWTQAKIIQRVTQRPNRKGLVVAQDNDTAGELFEMGEKMYGNLPIDPEIALKPALSSFRSGKSMTFGEPSRLRRAQGHFGLNSKLEIDTAKEVEAGRGFTFTDLHVTEVAFWIGTKKMVALLNAVPDDADTMIVIESTANGGNHFKKRWDRAVAGDGSYIPVFAAWHEDPDYARSFLSAEERGEFIAEIGEGEWGEDEPRLVESFGCTPEQLNWRRYAIVDKCESDLDTFKQEYPASPEEAFLSTGKQVFSMKYVSGILDRCERTDPLVPTEAVPGPDLGLLQPSSIQERKVRAGMVEVPLGTMWVPREASGFGRGHPFWKIWQHPFPGAAALRDQVIAGELDAGAAEARIAAAARFENDIEPPEGRYVVAVDPASGEETEEGEEAAHAIEVIDHRTKLQVAEYSSRVDPDLVGYEALLVAIYYNRAWLAIERTGGYGISMLNTLWRDMKYPFLYKRRPIDGTKERDQDRLGWDTNRSSKPLLEDGGRELLRTMRDGIQSRALAGEMTTYVRDAAGKTGPDPTSFSDRLMAWLIAQQVAQEKVPLAPKSKRRPQMPAPRNPKTGY